jgi:hypothetical protein
VLALEPDDPTVALYDALGVSGHVVADDRPRLLEVLALREHVGRQQEEPPGP